MKENTKFYICKTCGKIIGLVRGPEVPTICCGQAMEELSANTTDGALEKHVPVFSVEGDELVIRVGSIDHPMEEDHYIMWVALVSGNVTTRISLLPGDEPKVRMKYIKGATIYSYCDKHGLWSSKVD